MTWKSHQLVALGCGLIAGLSGVGLGGAWLGGIAPDVVDQRWAALGALSRRGRDHVFAQVHRGTSHWFGLWLLCLLVASFCPQPWLRDLVAGVGLGGFSHVVLDFLTPKGVPLLPLWSRLRLSLPLCRTGSLGEYGLVGALLAAGGYVFGAGVWAHYAPFFRGLF